MRRLFLLGLCILFVTACKEHKTRFNGYIDADLTYLSSNTAGRLSSLLVKRGQAVHKNQLLFKLEQTTEKNAITLSQLSAETLLAQRKQITDQIHYSKINYRRNLETRKNDASSQNDLDLAKKDLDVLNHQLAAIDFQIKSAQIDILDQQWQVAHKEAYAPDEGLIFDTYYTADEFVQGGQPVLALITKPLLKVIFFVPEKDLSSLHLNAKVNLSADGNSTFAIGTINYISKIAQYTPPMLFSRDERHQLVFRVEAGIDNPELNQIHLGEPVTLEIIP